MQTTIDISVILNGIIVFILGYAGWQFKQLISKVNDLAIDVAVIKSQVQVSAEDHDKVIILEAATSAAHRRIDEITSLHGVKSGR